MKTFGGKAIFLDKSDINTDEIIPAKYLTEATKPALRPYILEDLAIEGFQRPTDYSDYDVIVTRENFGCGSSREHAPWVFEVNGINVVIAESFARIFRQNMYNCGMLAIELSKETISNLFTKYSNIHCEIEIDLNNGKLIFCGPTSSDEISFSLEGFERDLVEAGGWVNYADSKY